MGYLKVTIFSDMNILKQTVRETQNGIRILVGQPGSWVTD